MMRFFADHIFPAAYSLLPDRMNTDRATAMLLAIGLQESQFIHRQQIRGPARSVFQFETAGVQCVLTHHTTADLARMVCVNLKYEPDVIDVYSAIRDNDVLATCFARLLLWTLPYSLPQIGQVWEAWGQYLAAWRPGKPHPETWEEMYYQALLIVKEG